MILDIDVEVQSPELNIEIEVQQTTLNLDIEVGTIIGDESKERYQGPYEVTPKISQQVLETYDKVMEDDVFIFPVPYQEVSNPQGGQTVIIAFDE